MNVLKPIAALTLVTVALAGCSSAKDASKSNFEDVLNGFYEKNCLAVRVKSNKLPVTLNLSPENAPNAEQNNKRLLQTYDVLEDAGLLDVEDGTTETPKNMFGSEKITVPTKTYSLSSKGEKHLAEPKSSGFFGRSGPAFCIGYYEVDEVKNFTEPSSANGFTISKVRFTVSPRDVEKWAKSDEAKAAFPSLERMLKEEQDDSEVLVLMNDGWVHKSEMK